MDRGKLIADLKEAGILTIILLGILIIGVVSIDTIVDAPFSESVRIEANSVNYPDVNQSVFFSLGYKSGQWTAWSYDEALPASITMDEDTVYYFYVDWYVYSETVNDSITIRMTSEEYIITRGLFDGNNGTLVFKPFNDRLRVTFTLEVLNILGRSVGAI